MTSSVSSNSASSTPAPIGDGLGALPENLEATFAHSDVDQTSARATVCFSVFLIPLLSFLYQWHLNNIANLITANYLNYMQFSQLC